jgi:hypothetical protein
VSASRCQRELVAPFVAGCHRDLLGRKRVLAQSLRQEEYTWRSFHADVYTAIGPSHPLRGWRISDVGPLLAAL